MTTFRYKGITAAGTRVSGVIKAYDEYEAVAQLRETCSVVEKIEEVQEKLSDAAKRIRIAEKDLAVMCSQFSIILGSGMPIVRCVELVAQQAKSRELRRMLEKVAEDIAGGYSMAQSFEQNCPGLPMTFIETVRAGEESGALETCFHRLHTYYDKASKTKAKIISTLTYPAIVVAVAIIVFIVIMAVAVPMFIGTFEELEIALPPITKALILVSNFITGFWWLIAGAVIFLCILQLLLRQTARGRQWLDTGKLTRTPLHRLNQMNASAQFAATMSTMIASGLPINRALGITGHVVTNYAFGLAVLQVKDGVEQGYGISECMGKSPLFPKLLAEMTGVGEHSGAMERTLDVVGEYYSNEVDVTTARLLAVLEPAITVALAVLTVILLLAVYLPMFSLYGGI